MIMMIFIIIQVLNSPIISYLCQWPYFVVSSVLSIPWHLESINGLLQENNLFCTKIVTYTNIKPENNDILLKHQTTLRNEHLERRPVAKGGLVSKAFEI